MIARWRVRHAAEHQLGNLRRFLSGRPVSLAGLGSTTLDRDDVLIAQAALKRPQCWNDPGPVAQYQQEFARWNGSRHAFAFLGGRVALSACIHALGLAPGDEVIVPGYTCVVVPNAFHYAGVQPVFCDIELETYGMAASAAAAAISSRTRALLIQHLYGLVARDYDALLALAARHGLAVIEDCAHATGALYRGRKVGTRGTVGFYSSEQSKVLNTIQGGIAVTDDDAIAERLRAYSEAAPLPAPAFIDKLLHNVMLNYYGQKHPQRWLLGDAVELRYGDKRLVSTTVEEEQGIKPAHYGCRMPAPVAALGLNQLVKIDAYNARRRAGAARWDQWCTEQGYVRPLVVPDSEPVFLRYPVIVEPQLKSDTTWAAERLGVQLGVWYMSHVHPAPTVVEGCPNADRAVAGCINFPGLL